MVAQQCGGSDAFSGVAGNPSSGGAVKRLIAAGGKSLLAETDELIGAEAALASCRGSLWKVDERWELLSAERGRRAWGPF